MKTLKIAAAGNRLYALRQGDDTPEGIQSGDEVWLHQYDRWERVVLPFKMERPIDIACAAEPPDRECIDVTLYVLALDGVLWERNSYGGWRSI